MFFLKPAIETSFSLSMNNPPNYIAYLRASNLLDDLPLSVRDCVSSLLAAGLSMVLAIEVIQLTFAQLRVELHFYTKYNQ